MIWGRVIDVFRRRRLDTELESQLTYHLDALEAEARARGLSPDDARAAARRAMGGLTQVQDAYRDQLRVPVIDTLWQDARYALRAMRHNLTFTVVVVLTLALGIGANAAVFSVVNSVLLKPLAYPRAEELVALRQIAPGAQGLASSADGLVLSPSMYLTYAENNRVFESLGVWVATSSTVTGVGEPEQVRIIGVTDGLLPALAVPAAAGRWFVAGDAGGPRPPSVIRQWPTVMLSYGYWQRRFGGDRSVIGRTMIVDSIPREIVGVMPQGFRIVTAEADMLFLLAFDRGRATLAGFNYQGVARLKPGITIAQANADMARMVPIWMDSWSDGPGTNPRAYETWKIAPALRPLKQEVVGSVTDVLWVVMATIGLVMLIACANVANLLLVRAEVRQKELSLRAALGAGRGRIVRSLLVESVLLGLMGGALGVGLAYAGLRVLLAIGPANLPRLSEISLDARTLGIHRRSLAAVECVVRIDPGAEIHGAADFGRAGQHRPHREREPRAPPRPQCAGGGAGGDRARAPGERRIDDSHIPVHTDRRAGIHGTRSSPDDANLFLWIGRSRRGTRDADAERHPGQAGVDSGRDLGGVRERRCPWKGSA